MNSFLAASSQVAVAQRSFSPVAHQLRRGGHPGEGGEAAFRGALVGYAAMDGRIAVRLS